MSTWNQKINKCILAALRATTHNDIDPVTHRTISDIRIYLAYAPISVQAQAFKAIKKINKMENLAKKER
jgi:hypothetical protein